MLYSASMPIIAQAAKKLRHDRKRTKQTMEVRESLRNVIKVMRKTPTPKTLSSVFQALDKAAKKNVIHKNKASRLKANLAKLIAKK
jgi:small subunit ribosomal protein S20